MASSPRPLRLPKPVLPDRAWVWALALLGVGLGLAAARVPLTWLGLAMGAVALVAVSLVEPLVGIGAALLVGPLRAWLAIKVPSPVPEIGQAVLVVALGAYLVRKVWRRTLRFPVPGAMWPLVGFLGMSLLSLWSPVDAWTGLLEWLKWLQVLLVAVVVYDRVTGEGGGPAGSEATRTKRVVALVAGAALSQALIGLWQFGLRGEGVAEFAIDERFFRAYGTFQQPNPFAGLMGLVGALLLGAAAGQLVEDGRRRGWRTGVVGVTWLGLPAGLIIAALGASWSRGGWMGFGAAVLVIGMLLPRRALWGILGAAVVIGVAGGLYVTGRLPAPVVARLTGFLSYARFQDVRGLGITDANYSVVERMAHWQAGLGMWRARFWLGVGLGGYEPAYPAYRLINWILPLGHAHNTYLNMLAETGLLGALAFLLWLAMLFVGVLRALRHTTGWTRALALGLAAAWTHFAVHSLVDSLLVNNVHLYAGVLVALTAWVAGQARDAQRSQLRTT